MEQRSISSSQPPLFNVNTPVGYDGTCDVNPAAGLGLGGEWLRPTSIVQPRLARLSFTVNFRGGGCVSDVSAPLTS